MVAVVSYLILSFFLCLFFLLLLVEVKLSTKKSRVIIVEPNQTNFPYDLEKQFPWKKEGGKGTSFLLLVAMAWMKLVAGFAQQRILIFS